MSDGRSTSLRHGVLLRALLVCCCGLWLGAGGWVLNIDAQFDFNIGPQKLSTALVELSRQANAPLVSDTSEVDRFDSAGISGRMALKDALRALLEGTNLDYRVTDQGVIAIGAFASGQPGPARTESAPSVDGTHAI